MFSNNNKNSTDLNSYFTDGRMGGSEKLNYLLKVTQLVELPGWNVFLDLVFYPSICQVHIGSKQ